MEDNSPTAGACTEPALAPPPDPSDPPGPSDAPPIAEPQLSKNQRKKLAKREAYLAARPAKRKAEKERRKQRAAERKAQIAAGEVEEDEAPRRKKRKVEGPRTDFGATLLVDCGFDELMTEKEHASLQSQLSHSYSTNRRASVPFERILVTSFSGKLQERCKFAYRNNEHLTTWKRVDFTEASWQDMVAEPPAEESSIPRLKKEHMVYLTADSPNVIEELSEGKCYIIGGLVDRNRHKNICFDRAVKAGVPHAQLPFGSYMSELKTRRVLTVNQVVEILSVWLEKRDWRAALEAVVPLRKLKNGQAEKAGEIGDGKDDGMAREEGEGSEEDVPQAQGPHDREDGSEEEAPATEDGKEGDDLGAEDEDVRPGTMSPEQ